MTGVLLALFFVALAGFGTTALLAGRTRLHWSEWVGLTWMIGGGVISLATWIFGLVLSGGGLRGAISLLAIVLGVAGWLAWRKTLPKWRRPTGSEVCQLLVLALLVGYAGWLAPQAAFSWDALMVWEAKSFIAFQNGGTLPPEFFADRERIFSWQFYPLFLSYLQSWIYSWVGAPDQSALAVLPPLFLGSTALLMVGALRRVGAPQWLGAVAMAGFFAIPYLFSGVWGMFAGYADFPMAASFFAAVWAAVWWQESRAPAALRLLALLAALLPWMKREGVYLMPAVLLVPLFLLLRERKWREMAVLVLPGAVVVLGWSFYLSRCHVVTDPTFARVGLATLAERIGPIMSIVSKEMVRTEYWSYLWLLAAVAMAVLAATRRWAVAGILACCLLMPLGVAVVAYLCSTWKDYVWHVYLSLERLVLQLAPVALLAIALACPWAPKTVQAEAGGE